MCARNMGGWTEKNRDPETGEVGEGGRQWGRAGMGGKQRESEFRFI